MDFIDKFVDHPWKNERNNTSFEEYVDGCDKIAGGCLKQLDIIIEIIASLEKQISEFETGVTESCTEEQIEAIRLYKGFADAEARLILFELDF